MSKRKSLFDKEFLNEIKKENFVIKEMTDKDLFLQLSETEKRLFNPKKKLKGFGKKKKKSC